MKREMLYVAVSSAMLALAGCAVDQSMTEKNTSTAVVKKAYAYPSFAKSSQVDRYPGDAKIADPYRGLEELDAPATRDWINGQNAVTNQVLAELPLRDAFKKRLTELWNFERNSVPYREGGRWFFSRNDGLQNQSVLYTQKALSDAPEVLLDPNTLSADGTVAINAMSVSPNGKYLAYALSEGGSDWQVWRIREIETGKDLPEKIEWSKFSGANWLKDGSGFYYGRFEKPEGQDALKVANKGQQVYLHLLGTEQSKDVMVYSQPESPDNMANIEVTEDGMYMVNTISVGTDVRNLLFVKTVAAKQYTRLIDKLEASFAYIGNLGSTFYLVTNHNAPKYQLIAIDLKNPARENWKSVIAESDATLLGVSMVGDSFVASYLRDAKAEVKRYSLDGKKSTTIQLPGVGKVEGFAGKPKDQETYFSFASFTNPSEIFKLDLRDNSVSSFRKPQVKFNSDDYMTQQVFYTSKDGTKVPMFITSKKDYVANGETPVLLYGYGGFNIPVMPNFSPAILAWVEKGGLYAVANLRGGGEYGEAWHNQGTKTQKQNVFDDFVAAAEFLIEKGHTKAKKIAINGRSNGGLLVAATQLQRPELFGAAIPAVGVLDMLRFNQFTIGKAWESDYGSPQNADEFAAIRKYSPLHNIRADIEYPPTLILTGDHDDRVFPAHSFKFAAQIQESYSGKNPMLIRIETRGGHGAGKPVSMQIEENADWMSFAAHYIGLN